MNIVRVALDLPLPRLFDYLAPDAGEGDIGRRVSVPFGTGLRTGVVVGLAVASEHPDAKLKQVAAILRDMPALPAEWLALCEFCARYYQTPLGEVTSFALPPMLRRGKLPRISKPRIKAPTGKSGAVPPVSPARDTVPDADAADMISSRPLPELLAAQQAAVSVRQTRTVGRVLGSVMVRAQVASPGAAMAAGLSPSMAPWPSSSTLREVLPSGRTAWTVAKTS